MSKTILLVDDSPSFRTLARMALEGAGYTVIEAQDGEAAVSMLNGPPLYCIVSDLNMPKMDGLTFVGHVKASPTQRFVPILMFSTESSKARMEQGRVAGVRAWMTKPFSPSSLIDAVARLGSPKQ